MFVILRDCTCHCSNNQRNDVQFSLYLTWRSSHTWSSTPPILSYISSCHKAHKALTFSFHPLRFAARVLTFAHDCHPAVFLSFSTILLHVVLGRPGLSSPFWPPFQSCHAMFLFVFPHYMSNPIPSSTSDFIARSVHSCVLLDLLVGNGLRPPYS